MKRKQDEAGSSTQNSTDAKTKDEKNNEITMRELKKVQVQYEEEKDNVASNCVEDRSSTADKWVCGSRL